MRRRSSLILALSLLALPAFAQAPSETTPPDKIDPGPIKPDVSTPPSRAEDATSGVPSSVFAVRRAGDWQSDSGKGFSRVIGVLDAGKQRLYAQWIAGDDGHVVATKEVVDEEAAKLTFGDIRAEPGDEGVTVFLDTEPDKDGMRDTWVMVLGAPGDVRFGPATN
ncbi:hypothetical protein ACFQI3_01400 [Hansschlegelia quercus]|uniref:Uncharacterized protein n=1 Tax=Hansschlegelia quercus TaxID=2528245 RepID=A0A4V2JEC2_9HYPH|nr:hypothetical protein [Hansschlegelia quercus]TBN54606.1 hypothetical protein EYR15_00040 [Hansschlegelia quercus]